MALGNTSHCWHRVVPLLTAQGHRVFAIDLLGRATKFTSAWNVSLDDHADAIVTAAKKEDGKVIAVGHSMGGLSISRAAEKSPECFEHLVYLTAFLPIDGENLLSLSSQDKDSLVPSTMSISLLRGKSTLKSNAGEVFYNDCSPKDVELARSHLVPEPVRPNFNKVRLTDARFGSIPRSYIGCSEDRAITPSHQKRMVERQPCERFETLKSSHSPFYSMPDELVKMLLEVSD